MIFRYRLKYTFFVAFSLLIIVQISSATTIDPLLWEQLVIGADFVGVVECQVAGGITAKYKIVDSWKGPKNGENITIRIATNYWGPQFPTVLCGERLLVTAYKSDAPTSMLSTTTGGGVPLWWRKISADYSTPLFQGIVRTPSTANRFFDSKSKTLPEFKIAAKHLISMQPEEQEMLLLRLLCKKYFVENSWRYITKEDINGEQFREEWEEKINKAERISELAEHVLTIGMNYKDSPYVTMAILEGAGGAKTLEILENLPPENLPFEEKHKKYIVESIQRRIRKYPEKRELDKANEKNKPTIEKLKEMKVVLISGQDNEQFWTAFDLLSVNDPESVAHYLITWVNEKKRGWWDENLGYVLGSYFAWRCGRDRKKYLLELLKAENDYVRVAGAVYLCFEDQKWGMTELKKLTAIKDDPGVWAALNLIRRGDKEAVPRALEVFKSHGGKNMIGVPHRNLQKRVVILLSNSSCFSGITMPEIDLTNKSDTENIYLELFEWWDKRKDKIKLIDAWLDYLKKQKID